AEFAGSETGLEVPVAKCVGNKTGLEAPGVMFDRLENGLPIGKDSFDWEENKEGLPLDLCDNPLGFLRELIYL
ncbi:MAG: hypothetical protein HXN43_08420, partial [Prevotella micans]|nr:hypothetical protein [Prevotella micans]